MTDTSISGTPRLRVGIVGGGLAGLTAARVLGEHGHDAVVFDKGRGPGGRTSSRRAPPFAFDHGAQYFTARDPEFRSRLDEWLDEGVVAPWDGRLVSLNAGHTRPVDGATERFVGVPRMSALARHLALGVEFHGRTRVGSLERLGEGWRLLREDGMHLGRFDRLVITAPPPQAAALIGEHSSLGQRAVTAVMRPSWAVLVGLAVPYALPFDGAFCEASALAWIARDSSKPGRPAAEAWVLHASSEWSESHLDVSPSRIVELLSSELERLTGVALPQVNHRDAHLWRFARPQEESDQQIQSDRENGLVLAGDGYCGGRVEGAYLSGVAAARWLTRAER